MDQPITSQSSVKDVPVSTGLTSDEARCRLEKFDPNAVADTALHPLRRALTGFWAPAVSDGGRFTYGYDVHSNLASVTHPDSTKGLK